MKVRLHLLGGTGPVNSDSGASSAAGSTADVTCCQHTGKTGPQLTPHGRRATETRVSAAYPGFLLVLESMLRSMKSPITRNPTEAVFPTGREFLHHGKGRRGEYRKTT